MSDLFFILAAHFCDLAEKDPKKYENVAVFFSALAIICHIGKPRRK